MEPTRESQHVPSSTSPMISSAHEEQSEHPHTGDRSFIREVLHFSFIALLVVVPIRLFVAQPFIVSGASMETTFSTGQYLIVDQLTYHFEKPERGDVIVFRYPKDPSKYFIKRIIGIPGDTVSIHGSSVTITNTEHPEGTTLTEPYIREMAPNTTLTETLGDEEYFVMGDNRNASSDSRMWGVLPRENIIGRAYVRLFPFTQVNLLPGTYDIDAHITSSSSSQ